MRWISFIDQVDNQLVVSCLNVCAQDIPSFCSPVFFAQTKKRIFSMNKRRGKRFGTNYFYRRLRRVPRLVRSVADKKMNLKVWKECGRCMWPSNHGRGSVYCRQESIACSKLAIDSVVGSETLGPLPSVGAPVLTVKKKIPVRRVDHHQCLEVGFTKIIRDRDSFRCFLNAVIVA